MAINIARTPIQIAQRAVLMGSMTLRASLEVTRHPRAVELTGQILPWLEQHGIGPELHPIEREVLATPYGQLRREQQTDASWSCEGAAVFCWAIGLTDK